MTSTSKTNNVTDVIVILDESASMASMGSEPMKAVDLFLKEQKTDQNNGAKATFVTFNTHTNIVFNDENLSDMKKFNEYEYKPKGGTALNDAICSTFNNKLNSSKSDNVVVLIITDGEENSSQYYSIKNTRDMINLVENKHSWKVIFMGANINAFSEGQKMNISTDRCAQYDQKVAGDLLSLCRTVSNNVDEYRRARSEGVSDPELKIQCDNNMNRMYTDPVGDQQKRDVARQVLTIVPQPLTRTPALYDNSDYDYGRSSAQSPINSLYGSSSTMNATLPDGTVIWM